MNRKGCLLAVLTALAMVAPAPGWSAKLALWATLPVNEAPEPVLRLELSLPGHAEAAVVPARLACTDRSCRGEVELAPGSWLVRAEEGQRFWIKPLAVVLGSGGQRLLIDTVLPKRRISGGATLPERPGRASALRLRFRLAGDAALDFHGESACGIAGATWTCEVPAAVLDLRFEADGLVPVHRWAVDLRLSEAARVESLAFEPGASLSGWLEGIFDDGAKLEVAVIPLADGSAAPTGPEVGRAPVRKLDRVGGFFTLGPLAPGRFEVLVSSGGRPAARLRPVAVPAGRSEVVRIPVRLERGAGLDVRVEPSTTPAGKPWKLRLLFLDASQELVEEVGVWEVSGELRISGLVPGEYRAVLSNERGDRLGERTVTLATTVEPLAFVVAAGVAVAGRVRLGESSLAEASLQFTRGGSAVRLLADSGGGFSGVVPEAGTWRVRVRSRSPSVDRQVKVEIDAPPGGRAEFDIRLPDQGISGTVIGADGRPVRAGVYYHSENDSGGAVGAAATDSDGRFEHRGLGPGRYVVWAEKQQTEASDPQMIDLVAGKSRDGIELRLKSKRRLAGVVVAGGGPVPGARLELVSASGPFHSEVHSAVAGPDGRFELSVMPSELPMVVTAEAGAWPLAIVRVDSVERDVVVAFPAEAGEVVLRDLGPRLPQEPEGSYSGLLLVRDGLPVSLWQHAGLGPLRTSVTGGGALEARVRIAPGPVVVCAGTVPELSAVLAGARSSARCAQGSVTNGVSSVIEIR